MELLDIYDEEGNHLGTEDRKVVHRDALWHKTVHAWLYDKEGNVYFQIRADEGTLYTTASGHLQAGDTVEDALKPDYKGVAFFPDSSYTDGKKVYEINDKTDYTNKKVSDMITKNDLTLKYDYFKK